MAQIKRGVRRAGPRSDANVSGRDTNLTPRELTPPGRSIRASPARACLRPGTSADRTLTMAGQDLAARPRTREREEPPLRQAARPPCPRCAGWDRCRSPPRRRDRPTGRNGSSGTAPPPTGPSNPCLPKGRPLRGGRLRDQSPAASARAALRGMTPAFRPMRPLPAKGPTPGLNDAPPKGWRSFRRRCFRRPRSPSLSEPVPSRAFRPPCEPNRSSSARRVPRRSFSERLRTDNNNRQVKPKILLTEFQYLHISRTKYPRSCPQLLMHSLVDIASRDPAKPLMLPACGRGAVAPAFARPPFEAPAKG